MTGPRSSLCALIVMLPLAGCGAPGAEADSEGSESSEGSEQPEQPEGSGEFEALIDQSLWIQSEAQDDPLAAHRPTQVNCSSAGWYVEIESLEINTNYCNYLSLQQPSLVPIHEGHKIQLGFYHFNLTALDPGLAHVAVLVDGAPLWEQEIEIPGSAAVYSLEFAAPLSAPAGAQVVLHLHNHGQNTWVLQGLSAEQ